MPMLVTSKQSSGFIIPSSASLQGVWHTVSTQYICDEQNRCTDGWMDGCMDHWLEENRPNINVHQQKIGNIKCGIMIKQIYKVCTM